MSSVPDAESPDGWDDRGNPDEPTGRGLRYGDDLPPVSPRGRRGDPLPGRPPHPDLVGSIG
jgi:hypothetical protein